MTADRLWTPDAAAYRLWRDWVLGVGRYAGYGARSTPRPQLPFGGVGQERVPPKWWAALEAYVAGKDPEPVRKVPVVDRVVRVIRADGRIVSGPLTAHFRVEEFHCKDGTRVPAVALPALKDLASPYLEPLRREFGPALVMSGYRPSGYNRRIGGAKFSQHIYDLTPSSVASDLVFTHGDPDDWAKSARRLSAVHRVGGVGEYATFVHIDNGPQRRW